MAKSKKYIGCKSWSCHQCKHYIKFLTVSSMQDICWNRSCFYENKDEIQPVLDCWNDTIEDNKLIEPDLEKLGYCPKCMVFTIVEAESLLVYRI